MQYRLGEFILDSKARTLTANGEVKAIRPKTLELLFYLADRNGQIISKQELLTQVWKDVKVDEGVIFQSIAEIRKLLENPKVILNYPRRGYEFTEVLTPLRPDTSLLNSTKKHGIRVVALACLALLITVLSILFLSSSNNPSYQQQIAVLPIKNHVVYANQEWGNLEGMEQVIGMLPSSESVYIYPSSDILSMMQSAGLGQNFTAQRMANFIHVSGATLVIQADIYGAVNNYKLVYKFHSKGNLKQGAVFAISIEEVLKKLSDKIAQEIALPIEQSGNMQTSEFSKALFSEAVVRYESDWRSSISFFESYLEINPNSIMASIYLSRLYLWQGRTEDAANLINRAYQLPNTEPRLSAFVIFVKGQVLANKGDWQAAVNLYTQAQADLANMNDWSLKGDISQHTALAYEQLNRLDDAMTALNQAYAYFEMIQSPIGMNSTQILMARIRHKQGNIKEARKHFEQANKAIKANQLKFLYSSLETLQKQLDF